MARKKSVWSSWEVIDDTRTRSLHRINTWLAYLRKNNPKKGQDGHMEFQGYKIIGPRGGISYAIEGREWIVW